MAPKKPATKSTRELWDRVSSTPADWLRPYARNKDLTAIVPYRTIELATEIWGPAGKDWGWRDIRYSMVEGHKPELVVEGILFYPGGELPIVASWLYEPDKETHKAALTDAITKALSYLGFHADVFLGLRSHKENPEHGAPAQFKKSATAKRAKQRQQQTEVDRLADAIIAASSQDDGATNSQLAKIRVNLNEARKAEEINRSDFYFLMLMSLAAVGDDEFLPKLKEYDEHLDEPQVTRLNSLFLQQSEAKEAFA